MVCWILSTMEIYDKPIWNRIVSISSTANPPFIQTWWKNHWINMSSPRTDTGTKIDHSPESNLQLSEQTMLLIFLEMLGYWEILGCVKTCHPTAFCYLDKYGLRNSCYWYTGTNGDFEMFYYWDTRTNVNLRDFLLQPCEKMCTSTFSSIGTNLMKDI